jgi:hypothetical protein
MSCCPPKKFTRLSPEQYRTTLVQKLTCVADNLRDLNTKFGARPYVVALVRTRWAGGERGVGAEEVLSVEPIEPTPLVAPLSRLSRGTQVVGVEEAGELRVSEISPRYTEDYLTGLGEDGSPVPLDQNFYWEITFPKANRADVRRRFRLASVPSYEPTKFQWTVDLEKVDEDRARNGDPEG